MTTDQNKVCVENLEKQKNLYTKMLEVSGKQLAIVQSTRGNVDVKSLNNLLAERQNLMERIDVLNQDLPPRSVIPKLEQLSGLFRELYDLMRSIDEQDRVGREIVQSELVGTKDKLKEFRVKKKAAFVYARYENSFEGRFFDQRK